MNKENLLKVSLKVSMIVIGDEILNGRTSDLNASWLSKFLFNKGLHFNEIRFIRDGESEILEALEAEFKHSDIVITSGGIGPTQDDLTKKVLAKYYGKKLIERADIAKIVTENYERFGRAWKPEQNFYHHFPEDFIGIKNPKGLAPGLGFYDEKKQTLLLSGPGVPREFSEMTETEFFPLIEKIFSGKIKTNYQTVVRTHSVPEEKIFGELAPHLWGELEAFGKVSSLPHTIGIDIVVTYQGDINAHLAKQEKIKAIFEKSAIKEFVWQYGNKSLSELILDLARSKKITFGFAESCTGGLTASKFTDLAGSSDVFKGGIIAYSNEIKKQFLGVSDETLKNFGAVSEECAKEMAFGAKNNLKVDIAISTTGIAGPTGGTFEKPLGTVCFGVSFKEQLISEKNIMPGDRVRKKDRFSDKALLILLRAIESYSN